MSRQLTVGRCLSSSLIILALFVGATALAHAAPSAAPSGVLDQVAQTFHDTAQAWGTKATSYAERLFLGLAVIGLIWNCGWLALQREDLGAFFSTFIRWLLFVGFFWWLTEHAGEMANGIFSSFRQMGGDIGGLAGSLGPSTPLDVAYKIDEVAGNTASIVHPINSISLMMVDLTCLIALCIVAANMLITLCSAWVMAYAGCVLVGFGAVKWTSDIAINYFRTVLGIAVTYMTMLLLVGLCQQVFGLLLSKINNGTATMQALVVIASVAIVLAFLIHKLPPLVGSITGNNGGAHGSFGMGTAIAAAATVGAAIATGGASLAASSAASAAGAAASGVAGAAGAGGGAAAVQEAVRAGVDTSGGMGAGDGASLADGFGVAGDDGGAAMAPMAEAMGDGKPGSSGRHGHSTAAFSSAGVIASGLAHAGVSMMDNAVGGSGYNGALSPGSGSQMAQRIAKWKAGTMGSNPYYPNAPAAAAGADGNQDGQDLGDGQAAASAPRSSMANRVAAFRAANATLADSLSHIAEEPVDADMEIADFVNGGLTPSTT